MEAENKKYILTDDTITVDGHVLHQIKALRSFDVISEGEHGGYIEGEWNLSHNGTCWVDQDTVVYEDAMISGDAYVARGATINGFSRIFDKAMIIGESVIHDSMIYNKTKIYDNAKIENAGIDALMICDNVVIQNCTIVSPSLRLGNGAFINSKNDTFCAGPIGSRDDMTSFYKTTDGIYVITGCFCGSIKKFRDRVRKEHGILSKHSLDYFALCKIAERHILRSHI